MKKYSGVCKIILSGILLEASLFNQAQIWPRIYGDNISAYGKDLVESYDKGYNICGCIMKNASQFKYGWIIKTDINGNILWNKKYGDYQVENLFWDFDRTEDGGIIIAGATGQYDSQRDPLFVKLDPCGEIEWCKIFLSNQDNYASAIIKLNSDGYLGMLTYYGGDAQNIRISLVKMDATGEPIWIKHLAQQDSVANEEGFFLYSTPDSNYLVSGVCFSPSIKPYFIKTDTSGEELWTIKWPAGTGGYASQCAFPDNNYIYNASHLRFGDYPKVPYLLKFNESGETIDQYPLMGDTIISGGATSLLLYNDSILFTGTTWTVDPWLFEGYSDILKTDTLGNVQCMRRLINEHHPPTSIIKSTDQKIIVLGYYYPDGNWDIYMWKMNQNLADDTLYTQPLTYDSLCPYEIQSDTLELDCGLFVNIDEIPTKEEYESSIKISPNPARDWVVLTLPDVVAAGKVEITVYDVFGREVEMGRQGELPVNRMLVLDVSGYPPGMYVVVVTDREGRRYSGKLVVNI
ncbi:MAG TPA: T9SS type A sorting domain-containing protein [Bacteroidales bacterium]|nr:T9SS type A sorting domain-containing protein [Bacteroidales bacterium]